MADVPPSPVRLAPRREVGHSPGALPVHRRRPTPVRVHALNEAGGGRAGRPVEAAAIASILITSVLFAVALAAAVARPDLWRIGAAGALLILLLERLIEREDQLRRDPDLGP